MYYAAALIREAMRRPAFLYQGVRKILTDVTWEHAGPLTPMVDFGYGVNKTRQMERNYFNAPDIKRVLSILAKRRKQTFTSVAVSMRNGAKEPRSQGWCMNSLVLMQTKEKRIVEVQYRSTELILKFTGDAQWLPGIVENHLGFQPNVWRFRFASCYLSGVYLPYLATYWQDGGYRLLMELEHEDPWLFESGTRFFLRSCYREHQHFPYSPENVAHRYNWKHNRRQIPRIRDYLEEMHKRYNKPLPKTFHTTDYIPRGKRKQVDEDEGD